MSGSTSAHRSKVLEKGLWGMSTPMFVDQAVIYTIPLIDMYFLSQISDSAAAAVGAVAPLIFVANAFLLVSAFAGASIASQRIGAGDYQRGNATIAAYSLFVVMLALIASQAVNWGGPWVASHMGLQHDVQTFAETYLGIVGWMVAIWGCRLIYQTILNIYGEPKWNTLANIVMFTVNIVGNSIAVFGAGPIPPSGIVGVALVGCIAAASSLCVVACAVHWQLKIFLPLKAGIKEFTVLMTPVIFIAAPSILEPMSFQAYMIVLNWMSALIGDVALKVKVYAFNTFLFCLMVSIAIGMATEVIIAQRVGRKEYALVNRQLKQSLWIALIGSSTLGLFWALASENVLSVFTQDKDIIAMGVWAFWLTCIAEPWRTINIVAGGALRCSGDASFSSISSIAVIWLLSVPLAYALAIGLEWGLWGILTAAIIDELVRAVIKLWRWKTGKWMQKGVIQQERL